IMTMPSGSRLYLLAPIVRGRKGEYRKEFAELQRQGFQRVKVDGELYEIDDVPKLNKKLKHDIAVVVDRLVLDEGLEQRLADSIETALGLSDGLLFVEDTEGSEPLVLSAKFACPVSGFTIDEIEPRLFSFNNPFGACPTCDGLGRKLYMDPDLVVPEPERTLADGAIEPWNNTTSTYYGQTLAGLAEHFGASLDTCWQDLEPALQDMILYGSKGKVVELSYDDGFRHYTTNKPFEGVLHNLERRWRETESAWMREELGKYQSTAPCEACAGYRLKPEALAVKIHGRHIGELTDLSIGEAGGWFDGLKDHLTDKQNEIATRILKEINERLGFLNNVGLGYLTLSRDSGSLSGGESQRIRLASQIGSGLTGVLYVLDEPSIGLHQRDNDRLLKTLIHLRDLGNTVIVVEHDEDAIRAADNVVDMGPGAGVHGGMVVAAGTPDEIMAAPESLTGQYLVGHRQIAVPKKRRKAKKNRFLELNGATANNLQDVSVKIPLGTFACITGVSGSGKSTLVLDTLYPVLARHLHRSRKQAAAHDSVKGLDYLDKVVDIDQSPIGRTPRSNPATYTGCFTPIRDWFAGLPEAKARGYKAGRFSFNVKGGRCEACQGDGLIKIEMHFLPDVFVTCDVCDGKRFNRETLEVKYRDHSIADVLDLTVEAAVDFFQAVPPIRHRMETLQRVGLGYIKLGQSATTLSGGEAQRVKLAKELARRATGDTLYILDEPTTGLHFEDVRKLLEVLHALVEQGNTVVVIEHNIDVIKTADYLIDLGPEGGTGGGRIVATGTPEEVAKSEHSYTGHYLARSIGLTAASDQQRSKKRRA
ncbi:MAG: excinuclease ABC subunit UvrA, partial [Pseudomonadota bacterium]